MSRAALAGRVMASLAEYLKGTPGGDGKDSAFIDGVVKALERKSVRSPDELVGAAYADFSWPPGALDAAGQAMVRRALERAAEEHAAGKVRSRAPRSAGRQSARTLVARPATSRQQRTPQLHGRKQRRRPRLHVPKPQRPPPLRAERKGSGRQRQTPPPQQSLRYSRKARRARAPIMSTLAPS